MTKKATLQLEFTPKLIEFSMPYFLVLYKQSCKSNGDAKIPCPFIDVFDKTGKPFKRINIEKTFLKHRLDLTQLDFVKFPKLQWSDRKLDEVDMTNRSTVLKKVIVIGKCDFE